MVVPIEKSVSLASISPPFLADQEITPTKFNLFIGTNGSGKTTLLNHLFQVSQNLNPKLQPQPMMIPEDRFYSGKLNFERPAAIHLTNIKNTVNIAAETAERENLNDALSHIFQRRVEIITNRDGQQKPYFRKNGQNIPTASDGRGIVNIWTIFEYIEFAPDEFPLFVEELSVGLHPSLLERFLNLLFNRLKTKKMQLFSTTQDPFVVFYFLKNKIRDNGDWHDTNPDFSVFHFSDSSGLKIEKITKDNIYSSMNSLMGDFNGSPDLQKFNLLFSKPD